MKNEFRSGVLTLLCFVIIVFSSSCKKDVCYDCDALPSNGTTINSTLSICEGDPVGNGNDTYTEEQVEAIVAEHESLGGTCTKR